MKISVVVPTWKRSGILRETLNALAEDSRTWHGGTMQAIVVCDGEDAGTRELSQGYSAHGLPVEWVFHEKNLGLPSARNTGAARASGELLLFLDDDTVAAPGLLRFHAEAHAQAEARDEGFRFAVCGRIVESAQAKQSTKCGEFLEKAWMHTLESYASGLRAGETEANLGDVIKIAYFGLNCSIRRELFEAAGGFNPMLRWMDEELELGVRLAMRGVRFLSTPATVYHRNSKDLVAYFCRCWRLGGVCDTMRAVKLGQHNAQTRTLTTLDTGPILERLANHAFWYGHRPGRRVANWLRRRGPSPSCRVTICSPISSDAQPRGTTRARWKAWSVMRGVTSWFPFRTSTAGMS